MVAYLAYSCLTLLLHTVLSRLKHLTLVNLGRMEHVLCLHSHVSIEKA